jgi:hypothetical protein
VFSKQIESILRDGPVHLPDRRAWQLYMSPQMQNMREMKQMEAAEGQGQPAPSPGRGARGAARQRARTRRGSWFRGQRREPDERLRVCLAALQQLADGLQRAY